MLDCFFVGYSLIFKHVLDQVDATARAVEFIAQRQIGRTGSRTEPAMHAFAQDCLGMCDARVLELFGGEVGLHGGLSGKRSVQGEYGPTHEPAGSQERSTQA